MIFATASGSKWGDYGSFISGYQYDVDVDKFLKEDDE